MYQIRKAQETEIDWINQRYDEVQFVHSSFKNEIIAVAEIDSEKAGLGRLVSVNKDCFELGGILVFESFRGQGIAGEIVKFLLGHVPLGSKVYCIPFQHLVPLYQRHGFSLVKDGPVPDEILKKFHWCGEKYSASTSLMVFHRN